ncbi:MAG: VWA domain-containing protein [Phycisphaerae bacterium]|nr:VWA domain-containing protein [Phycisphaerae bacterium]
MILKNSYLEQVARGLIKLTPTQAKSTAAILNEFLLVLLDCSGSMNEECGRTHRLGAAQDAILRLLDTRRALKADDQIAVIAFHDDAHLVLPPTRCRDHGSTIEKAIRSITGGGGTSLAVPLILAGTIVPGSGAAHIVMLSDGHGGDPTSAADKLKRRGAIIETIGVGNDPAEVAEDYLRAAASVLNGKVLYRFITDADEMSHYFRTEIANRLVYRSKS